MVVSQIGRDLFEKFFRGYTRKQWGMEPSELDAQVTARIPSRTNTDDRYFTDTFQFMPLHGYHQLFDKILSHPNVEISLNTNYREVKDVVFYRKIIYTGPIDEYFECCYGKLPFRSLKFQHETLDTVLHLPASQVNFPNEHAYTRISEFKQFTWSGSCQNKYCL